MKDAELLALLKHNPRKGMKALTDQYAGYLYAVISRIANGSAVREDIEECAADALHALWCALDAYDAARGDLKHYAAAIARNKGIDMKRRLSGEPDFLPLDEDILTGSESDPADAIVREDRMRTIRAAIEAMEPPDPEIFRRRYYWGDSLRSIAQTLGLSERAVEGRLYRGRLRLREALKED